jgi:hypothetical protein
MSNITILSIPSIRRLQYHVDWCGYLPIIEYIIRAGIILKKYYMWDTELCEYVRI